MSLAQLDANQIVRMTYDPISGATRVGPAYVTDTPWVTAITANATHTFPALNVLPYRVIGITVTWTGLSASGGTLTFQGSTNGVNWFIIGSAYTIAATSGAEGFSVTDEPYQYVQIVYAPGSTTTGTLSSDYVMRA